VRILLTGASSFTGYWFAEALAARGHEIIAPLRRPLGDYDPNSVRDERVRRLARIARLVPDARFGSDGFQALCGDRLDLLCHHAAQVDRYREPDFDVRAALAQNTRSAEAVVHALSAGGAAGMVLTGTVFEPDEGEGDEPRVAVSPYGLSKALTWGVFQDVCARAGLPLGKFVIPNPFGPWEEARFGAHLTGQWLVGRPASVRTPLYVRDNIHVSLLAQAYAGFAEGLRAAREDARLNPSGYVETQAAFAERMALALRPRLGVACELEILAQTDLSEPLRRVNFQPATALAPGWSETAAWDAYAEFALERARKVAA